MDLISLVVVLIVVGSLLWVVNAYIPMDARIKQILNFVVIITVILWLLNAVGVLGMLPQALVSVAETLIVVGILLWLVNSYLPMEPRIKRILNFVVIIAVIVWLINTFGILSGLQRMSGGMPFVAPQTVTPSAVSPPAVSTRRATSPPAAAGVYRGHLTEIKGSRQSDFDLDITKVPGALVVYESVARCKNASVSIFAREGDSLQLETTEVPMGCERSFALKVSDSGKRLTGTMRYEGSNWDVTAERK